MKNDVPGWMSERELDTLSRLLFDPIKGYELVFNRPIDRPILELGSFLGRSAVQMAMFTLNRIICVDPWDSTINDFPEGAVAALDGDMEYVNKYESIYNLFLLNIRDDHNIFPIRMSSREFHWVLSGCDDPPGLIFIDGDHSVPGVKFDLEASLPGGQFGADHRTIIAGHDYGHPYLPHIKPMVDEFAEKYRYKLHTSPEHTIFYMMRY